MMRRRMRGNSSIPFLLFLPGVLGFIVSSLSLSLSIQLLSCFERATAFQTTASSSSSYCCCPPPSSHYYWNSLLHSKRRSSRRDDSLLKARRFLSPSASNNEDDELDSLKAELTAYLEKRKQVGADEAAKKSIGTVVGGTRGNKILEYVSGAPNKPVVQQDPPEPLDYDELTKYGYGHLVKRIMEVPGGRLAMYELLGMDVPARKVKSTIVSAPQPLVIDRTGENDPARYSGLKLGQVLDDTVQAAALENVQKKLATGGGRPSVSGVREQVEAYEQPFADKRNVGPKQTPDWTVEKIDEWARQQGRVEAWARRAKEGAFVRDPYETLLESLLPSQLVYSVVTTLTATIAFGRATPQFIEMVVPTSDSAVDTAATIAISLKLLQTPAIALLAAGICSSIYCAITASSKNRSQTVWGIKGLLGGPLAVRQLVTLSSLVTQKEQDDQTKASQQ